MHGNVRGGSGHRRVSHAGSHSSALGGSDRGQSREGNDSNQEAAHVEYLGDLEGVARAKSELVTALPPTGVAILNADDLRVAAMASVSRCPVLRYAVGDDTDAEVRADHIVLDGDLRP